VVLIVVGFFSGLAIVLYVMLKKDTSHVQDAEKVYVYSKRVRHVAKVVGVVLTVLFVWGAVQWQNRVSIRPTAKGKVGIWVARLTGDDTNFSAQRGIVQDLEYFLGKEVDLHDLVEIRELPNGIQGKTVPEKNENLVALQGRYGASIIVWGEIAGFKLPELYPMVTVAKWPGIKEATLRLKPITEMDRQMEQRAYVVSQPPDTVRLPPERIREPLKLARFVAGVIFYGQRKWTRAAEYLEKFVSAEVPSAVEVPDVYFYIGLANQRAYLDGTRNIDAMSVAENYFHKALKTYKEQNNWVGYSSVQNDLALAYKDLAERGVDPEQNLQRALRALEEAAHLWKEQQNWAEYATVQYNLGTTYEFFADRGVDPEQNLQRALRALEEAAHLWKEQQNRERLAMAKNGLGMVYKLLAKRGVDPEQNLQRALRALEEAAHLWK
jgi:tetratricopeptide (TPR) repeat protein